MNQYPQNQPGYYNPTPAPPRKQGFSRRTVPMWFFLTTIITMSVIVVFLAGRSISNGSANTSSSTTTQASSSSGGTTNPSANGSATHKYQGNGNLKTDPITITSNTWQMNWTCDPNSFDGIQWNFLVSLYNTDGSVLEYYTINELCSPGIKFGSKTESQDGTFYLEIIAEGSWTLTIQETS